MTMRDIVTRTDHVCEMPKPTRKYLHRVYVCNCLCGWTVEVDRRFEFGVLCWVQVF